MPPPSSGGVTMIEMLNILENFDLPKLGAMSPQALHYEIEAMRRGYLDRARYLGDPDFVKMPLAQLMSKSLRQVARRVDRSESHASSSAELGKDIVTQVASTEDDETTQFSIVDKQPATPCRTRSRSRADSARTSSSTAPDSFSTTRWATSTRSRARRISTGDIGTAANLIAPGKRMLSSMSPTIITKDGKLFMVTGSPGGRTIINTVMEIVLNGIDFGMDARQAVDAPRFHHQWLPDEVTFERNALPDSAAPAPGDGPHGQIQRGEQGDGHTIIMRDGVAYGANDHRSPDSKVSVP